MSTRTSYVCTLRPEQVTALRARLEEKGWSFSPLPHAHWKGEGPQVNAVAYLSGKLTVQGKGTAEFVEFLLEPEILGEARFGYEAEHRQIERPEMFAPHAGIDESGKGDYFGPLVIAAAYVDADTARALLADGVADSKTIKSDKRIHALAASIRQRTAGAYSVVAIGPEAYNRIYARIGNVNRLLAWGHARALENLLEKVPDCPRAVSDQFGNKRDVLQALLGKGRGVKLEQMHRAEADVAVAAASILARAEFIARLAALGTRCGVALPRGAGPPVDAAARQLVARPGGSAVLPTVAKLHFRTTAKVAPGLSVAPVRRDDSEGFHGQAE
jgi:ribonuclease HIII